MRDRRRRAQEVAPEVDGDPSAGLMRSTAYQPAVSTHVARAAVEKVPWVIASECQGGWVEPEDHRVGEQFRGYESDGGIEG